MVGAPKRQFKLPSGTCGNRLLYQLVEEWKGVREGRWNLERPLVFVMVVLQQVEGVTERQHVIKRINQRLDDWREGRYKMLVETTYREGLMFLGRGQREMSETEVHLQYNNLLIAGKIRKAVRFLTERDQGGILLPMDACTKTGKPVEEVLRDKPPPRPSCCSSIHSVRVCT